MRNTIFISHTHYERDNLFARWLNAKLKLIGYDSWCELDRFVGGEECWLEIQDVLKENTILFLVVVSKRYCDKLNEGGSGIRKELNFAQKSSTIPNDNIVPILIDNFSLEDLPIELNPHWFIDSENNWELALQSVIQKIEKEKIFKLNISDSALSYWYKSKKITNSIIKREETYYSNWWGIPDLPKMIYVFRYHNKQIAREVAEWEVYPCFYYGNHVCSFSNKLVEFEEKNLKGIEVEVRKKHVIPIEKIINKTYHKKEYPNLFDAQYLLKRILKKAFISLFVDRELKTYDMSNKQFCFFYNDGFKEKNKVTYNYKNEKAKTKKLVGKYLDDMWHFGVSSKVILEPFVAFSLKSHIVFSQDGKKIWSDKKKVHAARRKKGKRFFNEEWRDLLIAFLHSLQDENGKILIPLNDKFNIEMENKTIRFSADFGYIEPNSTERLEMMVDEFNDEEQEL